jgi:hypothetical protein
VDWITLHVEDRIYDLTVSLTPVEPPGRTILWGRTHPLDEAYLAQLFELA